MPLVKNNDRAGMVDGGCHLTITTYNNTQSGRLFTTPGSPEESWGFQTAGGMLIAGELLLCVIGIWCYTTRRHLVGATGRKIVN